MGCGCHLWVLVVGCCHHLWGIMVGSHWHGCGVVVGCVCCWWGVVMGCGCCLWVLVVGCCCHLWGIMAGKCWCQCGVVVGGGGPFPLVVSPHCMAFSLCCWCCLSLSLLCHCVLVAEKIWWTKNLLLFVVWLPHFCQWHGTWNACQVKEGRKWENSPVNGDNIICCHHQMTPHSHQCIAWAS